jgi:hypothetical protein
MKKKIIGIPVVLMIMVLTACTEQRISYERFGRFILTTRLTVEKLKWEGGNSHLNYVELCRDDGELCFRGNNDLNYSYSRKYKRLLVHSSDEIKIYDTGNGIEISCDLSSLKERLKYAVGGYWAQSSLIVFSRTELNSKSSRATVISFNSGRCQITNTIDDAYQFRTSGRSQDVESRRLAWFECRKDGCKLSWLDADFITLHNKEIGCNEFNQLDIAWNNGVPEPRNFEWPKDQICLNENGELKYPLRVLEMRYDHIADQSWIAN